MGSGVTRKPLGRVANPTCSPTTKIQKKLIYGVTKENKRTKKKRTGTQDRRINQGNHAEGFEADRDGHQGEARPYHPRPGSTARKDTCQWRAQTKEQAR